MTRRRSSPETQLSEVVDHCRCCLLSVVIISLRSEEWKLIFLLSVRLIQLFSISTPKVDYFLLLSIQTRFTVANRALNWLSTHWVINAWLLKAARSDLDVSFIKKYHLDSRDFDLFKIILSIFSFFSFHLIAPVLDDSQRELAASLFMDLKY